MFEKILPVVATLVALQFIIRFMWKRRSGKPLTPRYPDYKDKIDKLMKVSNYDDIPGYDRTLSDDIRSGIGNPEIIMSIPDTRRDVRRNLNLIIDGVNHAVKGKTGNQQNDVIKYKDAAEMFDELVDVINRHKIN